MNDEKVLTREQALEIIRTYKQTHSPLTYGLSKKLFQISELPQVDPYIVLSVDATDGDRAQAQEQLKSMTDESLIYI